MRQRGIVVLLLVGLIVVCGAIVWQLRGSPSAARPASAADQNASAPIPRADVGAVHTRPLPAPIPGAPQLPGTLAEALAQSPAFDRFLQTREVHARELYDYSLQMLHALDRCVDGRVKSRATMSRFAHWKKLPDGKTWELESIEIAPSNNPEGDRAIGLPVGTLTPEENAIVQSCASRDLRGYRRPIITEGGDEEDRETITTATALTFPIDEDVLYRVVRDGALPTPAP